MKNNKDQLLILKYDKLFIQIWCWNFQWQSKSAFIHKAQSKTRTIFIFGKIKLKRTLKIEVRLCWFNLQYWINDTNNNRHYNLKMLKYNNDIISNFFTKQFTSKLRDIFPQTKNLIARVKEKKLKNVLFKCEFFCASNASKSEHRWSAI